MKKRLIINPGSTSTKIAVCSGTQVEASISLSHRQEELTAFPQIVNQIDYRFEAVKTALTEHGFDLSSDFEAVIGIGGLLKNVLSGVYTVNDQMVSDLSEGKYGEHAANLGALIVKRISERCGIPCYIADPITVDEMQDIARLSGHPLLPRYGRTHTLNHKRVAMTVSRELGKSYEDARLIIAHLGGGVSIGAHAGGRIIDSTSSRGEGAFSMDRSGSLNSWELAKLCFSGKYETKDVLKMLNGNGGVCAYLNTRDFRDVEARRNAGDKEAAAVFEAMMYQVAKEIGAMAAVLDGRFDAVVLTGGIVYSEAAMKILTDKIGFLGRIVKKPGEEEMESLAFYLDEALSGRVEIREYK